MRHLTVTLALTLAVHQAVLLRIAAAESLYAEAAKSADLGYTWGSYETAAAGDGAARAGHYARVWVRNAAGAWRVVLDLDAPKRARP